MGRANSIKRVRFGVKDTKAVLFIIISFVFYYIIFWEANFEDTAPYFFFGGFSFS